MGFPIVNDARVRGNRFAEPTKCVSLAPRVRARPNTLLITKRISATYPGNFDELAWNGLNLQIPGTEKHFVVEESAMRFLMAFGVERAIVDQASSYLVSRIRPNLLSRLTRANSKTLQLAMASENFGP
jgi:hypothetical protein